jgi:ABC-type Fe3+ transport system permease subunit
MVKTWEVWLLAAVGLLVGLMFRAFLGLATTSPNDDIPAIGNGLVGAAVGAVLGCVLGYLLGAWLRRMKPGPSQDM